MFIEKKLIKFFLELSFPPKRTKFVTILITEHFSILPQQAYLGQISTSSFCDDDSMNYSCTTHIEQRVNICCRSQDTM